MSMKTYVEAIEYVLDTELDARNDLICMRPGAKRALEEPERDVPLPRIGKKAFSVALGAALCGMHPVLDLRQESGAAQLLRDALDDLPAGMEPVMTVIACAADRELIMELPGAYVLEPRTPRQAAGFLRSALKLDRLTIVLADQTLFAEEDDIPEDRSFALLPLEQADEQETEAADEAAQAADAAEEDDKASGEQTDEAAAYDEAEEVTVFVPSGSARYEEEEKTPAPDADAREPEAETRKVFLASRQTRCDLAGLHSLCDLLEMDESELVQRCAGHVLPVCGGFELHYEPEAGEGEAAFLPPEEETASLWLGHDMLTISYDPAQMEHAEAANLLRAVRRVLEKPQLLIYDKEYDER